jgi:hypothetical protein
VRNFLERSGPGGGPHTARKTFQNASPAPHGKPQRRLSVAGFPNTTRETFWNEKSPLEPTLRDGERSKKLRTRRSGNSGQTLLPDRDNPPEGAARAQGQERPLRQRKRRGSVRDEPGHRWRNPPRAPTPRAPGPAAIRRTSADPRHPATARTEASPVLVLDARTRPTAVSSEPASTATRPPAAAVPTTASARGGTAGLCALCQRRGGARRRWQSPIVRRRYGSSRTACSWAPRPEPGTARDTR